MVQDIEDYRDGEIKTFSSNMENLRLLENINEQTLIVRNIRIPKDKIRETKNYMLPIINNYIELFAGYEIELKLVTIEQPFYNNIITKEQLLETPYDLFFSVKLNTILSSVEKFLEFMILKDRFGMILLEDIIVTNPIYQRDPWYSDEVNKLICWDANSEMKNDIKEKFEDIITQMKIKNTNSKELASMFTSISNIPPYKKNIANIEDYDNIYKLVSTLQMANIFTQKEMVIYNIKEDQVSTIERFETLLELITNSAEEFLLYLNDTKKSLGYTLFNHGLPLMYKKFTLMSILDKEPLLKKDFLKDVENENGLAIIKLIENETKEFINDMKDVLNGKIKPPVGW